MASVAIMVHFRVLFSLLGLCLALPDLDCDEGECALSLRQLRGQKFESAISEHAGPLPWEGVCNAWESNVVASCASFGRL